MSQRPLLVTVIGALTLLGGLIMLALGAVVIIDPSIIAEYLKNVGLEELVSIGGWPLIIGGLIDIIVAAGFLKGWSIIWYIGVVIYGLILLTSVLSLALSLVGGIGFTALSLSIAIPLVIAAVILYYLFRPNVKEFFGI